MQLIKAEIACFLAEAPTPLTQDEQEQLLNFLHWLINEALSIYAPRPTLH